MFDTVSLIYYGIRLGLPAFGGHESGGRTIGCAAPSALSPSTTSPPIAVGRVVLVAIVPRQDGSQAFDGCRAC